MSTEKETEITESGLDPCPFCGDEPLECREGNGRYVAKCYVCSVYMVQDRRDKLRGIWNRREGSKGPNGTGA